MTDSSRTPHRRVRVSAEGMYLVANVMISLAVAMIAATDLGLSSIVSPAYLVSVKSGTLTFGQCEYLLQGLLFIVMCLLLRRFRLPYIGAFLTCLFYGAILDLWRAAIPLLNPAVTEPGSMGWPWRILLFVCGLLLTSCSIALFFRVYLPPQVYDIFVKVIGAHFHLNMTVFKMAYDIAFLLLSLLMTFLFFGRLVGIGIGTVITACVNGPLITWFGRLIDRYFDIQPTFPRLAAFFED